MNWREYEGKLLQDVKDAKHNLEYYEKKYKEAVRNYQVMLNQKKEFDREIEKMLGG